MQQQRSSPNSLPHLNSIYAAITATRTKHHCYCSRVQTASARPPWSCLCTVACVMCRTLVPCWAMASSRLMVMPGTGSASWPHTSSVSRGEGPTHAAMGITAVTARRHQLASTGAVELQQLAAGVAQHVDRHSDKLQLVTVTAVMHIWMLMQLAAPLQHSVLRMCTLSHEPCIHLLCHLYAAFDRSQESSLSIALPSSLLLHLCCSPHPPLQLQVVHRHSVWGEDAAADRCGGSCCQQWPPLGPT